MLRKNWRATGSFVKEDRPRALDLLGFSSQLVFNTFLNKYLLRSEQGDDLEFAYGLARAHNRAIVDFCAVDRRLLGVGYVPLADFERARAMAARGDRARLQGADDPVGLPARPTRRATSASTRCGRRPRRPASPSSSTSAAAASSSHPSYFVNGLPAGAGLPRRRGELPLDRLHGDPLPADADARDPDPRRRPRPLPASQDRRDRAGRVLGAGLDAHRSTRRFDAFRKNEERLQKLALRPSEYVRRSVRVTPYPAEPVGWIVANAGEEVCLFSSDYPHVEGGRNPLRRFEASLEGVSERAKQRFYCDNFVDLMGEGLPVELRGAA